MKKITTLILFLMVSCSYCYADETSDRIDANAREYTNQLNQTIQYKNLLKQKNYNNSLNNYLQNSQLDTQGAISPPNPPVLELPITYY